jgi:hypothetical protein
MVVPSVFLIENPFEGKESRRETNFNEVKSFRVDKIGDQGQGFRDRDFSKKRNNIKTNHDVMLIKVKVLSFLDKVRGIFNKGGGLTNKGLKFFN